MVCKTQEVPTRTLGQNVRLRCTSGTRFGLAYHRDNPSRYGSGNIVADANSRVRGFENLWVGGINVIPDSTASNPTRTSVSNECHIIVGYSNVLKPFIGRLHHQSGLGRRFSAQLVLKATSQCRARTQKKIDCT